ncbi:MAG: glycosyltransferase [Cyanobacteria bacterium NC_groundwater_1444_Ag_S-0.65um_54_12]|nr:glycosyltransferase [Cyanobacteria bacterium NC_groundwater_1444_Ag_S-0.65um_54_12]
MNVNSRKPIVLISAHTAHAGLIRALETQGAYRVIVLGSPEFATYWNAARQSVNLAELNGSLQHWIGEIISARPFYLSGRDLTAELAPSWGAMLLQSFPGLWVLAEAFERLHRAGPIRAVVVHNDVAPNLRVLIAVAARHHIPTIHLPHGIELGRFPLTDFDDLIRTTVVCAPGPYTRDWYLKNPRNSAEQIIITGRPEWDIFYRAASLDRDMARRALGIDLSAAPVVGFAGSWAHTLTTFDLSGMMREAFRAFLAGIAQLGPAMPLVMVRPHPGHKVLNDFGPEWHRQIAAAVGVPIMVPDVPQETFLAAADLVVGLDSNFLVVALLAQRLALSIVWPQPGTGTRSGYEGQAGIATCQPDPDSIGRALRSCLHDEAFRDRLATGRAATLEELNAAGEGCATERVVQVIIDRAERASAVGSVPEGGYYGRINQRLADMVPATAKRILEVGCAAGYLGAWLKEQDPERAVIGIEAFADAAAAARVRLDAVIEGDVETLAIPYPDGSFDCIIYGDVLEHLKDPGAVLSAHRRLLGPQGELLVCVPNIGHWSVIRELLTGNFDYTDEGLLDRTHLRMFTRQSFLKLLEQAGLQALEVQSIAIPNQELTAALVQLAHDIGIANPQLAADTNAYQLLFRAGTAVRAATTTTAGDFVLPDRRKFNIVLVPDASVPDVFLGAEAANSGESCNSCHRSIDLAHSPPALRAAGDPLSGQGQSSGGIAETIAAYLAAFPPEAAVGLHVLAGPAVSSVQAIVLTAIERHGMDPDNIPLISLLDQPGVPAGLTRYLMAADLVIGPPQVAARARRLGIPAFGSATAENLRVAASAFGSFDWNGPPSQLDEPASWRWLVSGTNWETPLTAFLATVSAGQEITLVIQLPPGQAETMQGAIASWLEAKGHDPERIPDVALVEAPAPSIGLFRQATAWVDSGDDQERAIALALGLPLLEPDPGAFERQVAKLEQGPVAGSSSVVMVTYNSLHTIAEGVRSVLQNLGAADELIVVDNASSDGTVEFLQSLSGQDPRVRIVFSEQNLGFSAGSNVGLRVAKGEYLVLLNPDTVVTPGWLDRMKQPFADPNVGAVGPTSDYVAGLQKYQRYLPDEGKVPDLIADLLAERNAGKVVETKLLIGFCLMVPRRVIAEVGLLDEALFLGNDDLDLSWRLREQGYRLVIATDAFVHHVGQVSFGSEPADRTRQLVQESTDALARKLVQYYGPGMVPAATELWGINWFTPTPGITAGRSLGCPIGSAAVSL